MTQFIKQTRNTRRGATPAKKKIASLYELTWAPLDSLLKGVNKIYYSPSGLLHRLSFAAIPTPDNQRLGERYELIRLSSIRQTLSSKPSVDTTSLKTALLLGGIEYEMDTTQIQNRKKINISLSYSDYGFESRGGDWRYLHHTEKEVDDIASLLNENNIKTAILKNYEGSEEAIKDYDLGKKSPNILHFATHGYFFSDPEKGDNQSSTATYAQVKNPLMRSGLVLAGGNHVWLGKKPIKGLEDGILTAYEISQMDLRGTELVVLSACETGLGDINSSEGVYGLQRAFKMAGVKYVLMSLWQVPDKQTTILMERFYKNWLTHKLPIRAAFSKAQQEMRDLGFDAYQWAGFVLVE